MLLTALIVLTAIACTALAWNFLRGCFAQTIIPAVRRHVGAPIAQAISRLVGWLDKPLARLRHSARQLFATFKQHVLGIKMRFAWKNAAAAESRATIHVHDVESGRVVEDVVITSIPPEELPPEIRELVARGKSVELDVRQAVSAQFEQAEMQVATQVG